MLTTEAVDKLKVNKVTDILNRDTVTVDRKSYESLKAVNDNINKSVKTITEAENIEDKKAELQQIKYEIRQAKSKRDDVADDYLQMKKINKHFFSSPFLLLQNFIKLKLPIHCKQKEIKSYLITLQF